MQTPAAMWIEMARERVAKLDPDFAKAQRRELHVAVGHTTEQYQRGYEIGLETARAMLATNKAAIDAGIADAI